MKNKRSYIHSPRFDSLAESDKKTLNVGIHRFPAWRSALKTHSAMIGRQVRLLCPWATHLTGLPLPLNGYTGSNRWKLDSKPVKVTSLSPGRGHLKNMPIRAKLQTQYLTRK